MSSASITRNIFVTSVLASTIAWTSIANLALGQERHDPRHYPGVVPGSTGSAFHQAPVIGQQIRHASETMSVVTWPGFQTLPDGSGRFFLQVRGHVAPKGHMWGQGYAIEIPNAMIALANNRSHLITTHYKTPVKEAWVEHRISQKKRGRVKRSKVFWYFVTKTPHTPAISIERAAEGFEYVYATFPPAP